MRILSIETSCDETALALVEAEGGFSRPKFKVLKNLIASQIKIHSPFGGVVPNLAKREHLKNLPILYRQIFGIKHRANGPENNLPFAISHKLIPDLIAVTVGPGLEPALWTGINFAKEIAKKYKKPLVGANHLEGHLYSFLLPQKTKTYHLKPLPDRQAGKTLFPAISLIVSGGHTILLLMKNLKSWKKLGETRDDAVGEAFDKVARLLKLPYPGGPQLEKLAKRGNATAINFPRPMINDNSPAGEYDFSFSGLKTSVLYYLRDLKLKAISYKLKADIAASFQKAAVDVLVKKTIRAAKEFNAKSIMLSGGVAANKLLRREIKQETTKTGLNFFVPHFAYNTDNAVMIAEAGYFTCLRRKKYKLSAQGNLNI